MGPLNRIYLCHRWNIMLVIDYIIHECKVSIIFKVSIRENRSSWAVYGYDSAAARVVQHFGLPDPQMAYCLCLKHDAHWKNISMDFDSIKIAIYTLPYIFQTWKFKFAYRTVRGKPFPKKHEQNRLKKTFYRKLPRCTRLLHTSGNGAPSIF